MFVWRDFIVLYKRTILEPFRHVFQPVLMAVTYALVFGKVAHVSVGEAAITYYQNTGQTELASLAVTWRNHLKTLRFGEICSETIFV